MTGLLLTGIRGGGGGGGTFPNITLTSPTFNATNGAFGGQTLSGGTGVSATVTVTAACGIGMWFTGVGNSYCTSAQITGALSVGRAWDSAEVSFDGGSQAISSSTSPSTASGTAVINDGSWHWWYFARDGLTGTARWWVDGTQYFPNTALSGQSTSLVFHISADAVTSGSWFDEIVVFNGTDDTRATPPTAAQSRGGNTNVIWHLDGNGTGT